MKRAHSLFGIMIGLCLPLFNLIAEESNSPSDKSSLTSSLKLQEKDSGVKPPLYVKSMNLQLNAQKRVFTYQGNVEVTRGDLFATADRLRGTYNENNDIERIVFEDNVVITRGEELRATSNRAVYFVPEARIELTESPELYDKGNSLTADKVIVFIDEDRTEAEGNVRVRVLKSENPFAKKDLLKQEGDE